MKYKIIYSPEAVDDLRNIYSYISAELQQDDIPMYEKFKQSNAASKNMVFDDDNMTVWFMW